MSQPARSYSYHPFTTTAHVYESFDVVEEQHWVNGLRKHHVILLVCGESDLGFHPLVTAFPADRSYYCDEYLSQDFRDIALRNKQHLLRMSNHRHIRDFSGDLHAEFFSEYGILLVSMSLIDAEGIDAETLLMYLDIDSGDER